MERLVIYEANKLDCSGLYALASDPKKFVVGERLQSLTPQSADETATLAVIFTGSQITKSVLVRMPRLKLIVTLSVGFNHIDLKECTARGITVCNVPTYGERTVAEYAMALMLALMRRLPEATERLKAGNASHADLIGMDVAGKTLLIIGTGRIGRNVIAYAKVLGMTVVAVDPYPNEAAAHKLGFTYVGLHDGLRQADIVSLHAPLTPETHHIINKQTIAIMKPGARIINTARGELINTTALLHALHTRRLGGVALDVIEGEQYLGGSVEAKVLASGRVEHQVIREIAEHEALLKLPNVIITNHNAYNTAEAHERMIAGGIADIKDFLAGKPSNTVQPSK